MAKGWRKQQTQDPYFRRAKAEGYRARSAYKLIELHERFHLLRPGATVLDLGAAPGSWSQVARRLVGDAGRVVAVDLQPIAPLAGVTTLECDLTQPACLDQIAAALPLGADLVLSDVSPAISGIAFADRARACALAEASLAIALRFLRRGGAFVVKVFRGEECDRFLAEVRRHFATVHLYKPAASRKESGESYVVGLHRRGEEPTAAT